ncbi:MAG: DUF4091 domain-containing protein [Lentisphaerae bacterium]|nr:DUF4091 domain-containing protein [Lentisphaerota bacterium]
MKSFLVVWAVLLSLSCAGDVFLQPLSILPEAVELKCGATVESLPAGLQIVLPKSDGSPETRWPTVTFRLPENAADYDRIVLEMTLTGGVASNFSYIVRDAGNGRFYAACAVESGLQTKYEVEYQRPAVVDAGKLRTFAVYRSNPVHESVFLIHSLSLRSDVPVQAAELSAAYRQAGNIALADRIAALPEQVRSGVLSLSAARVQLQAATQQYDVEKLSQWREQSRVCYPQARFAISAQDGLAKVRPGGEGVLAPVAPGYAVRLARNEREGLQIFVLAPLDTPVQNLSIRTDKFSAADGAELQAPEVAPMGTVTVVSGKGTAARLGDYFDPICEFTNAVPELSPGRIQAFHCRFRTQPDTPPGVYSGHIVLESDNCGSAQIPLAVTVWNFTLPVAATIRTATSVYGSPAMGKHRHAFLTYLLQEYRINPFSIYSDAVYGEPVLPPVEEYLQARKIGLNFLPILYLKLPRQALHSNKGLTPADSKAAWDKLTPEQQRLYPADWKQRYHEILRQRLPELKAAGLMDIAYCYGFDEATPSEWPAIVDLVSGLRREFPELRIISTAGDYSYGADSILNEALDGWIPGISYYSPKDAAAARQRGKEVWYYTAGMTIDNESLADIRASLGSRAYAARVDGWLVWTVSRWGKNQPISTVPATGWNPESYPGSNGGGSYFCMGPAGRFLPTIRAEAIRDGIEDHAYFSLLARALSENLGTLELRQKAAALLQAISPQAGTSADKLRLLRKQTGTLLEELSK